MKNKLLLAGLLGLCAVSLYAAAGTIWTLNGKGSRRNTVEWTVESTTVGTAAHLRPGTDNTNDLGSSSYRVRNVYGVNGIFSGPVSASAGFGIVTSSAPRTAVGIAALYASYTIPAGTLFFNTQSNVLCISSSTVQTSITVSTGTAACPQ